MSVTLIQYAECSKYAQCTQYGDCVLSPSSSGRFMPTLMVHGIQILCSDYEGGISCLLRNSLNFVSIGMSQARA